MILSYRAKLIQIYRETDIFLDILDTAANQGPEECKAAASLRKNIIDIRIKTALKLVQMETRLVGQGDEREPFGPYSLITRWKKQLEQPTVRAEKNETESDSVSKEIFPMGSFY